MFIKTFLYLMVIFSLYLPCSFAGPFGVEMGMKKADLKIKREIKNGYFVLQDVPKPHSAFTIYLAAIAPKAGVFMIKGMGRDIETSVYGTALHTAFTDMISKLEERYGKHLTLDYLKSGSIWDEPKDFMTAVKKRERLLMAKWARSEGSTMPDEIEAVGLAGKAKSRNKGHLIIEYLFSNGKEGQAELAALEDNSL